MARKDLALQAIAYGNVYVAQVAMGANPQQTLDAFREAEAYEGPSLILAYSQCIAHGIDMRFGMKQQDLAVASGYWPLLRYNPAMRAIGENPFRLDSPRPTIPFKDYAYNEIRYSSLAASRPEEAAELLRRRPGGGDREVPPIRGSRGPRRRPFPAEVQASCGSGLMDLTTRYMGLKLKNPLVASASPLNADIGNIRRLEDAGAAAVVLPSLFEEQIEAEADTPRSSDRRRRREFARSAELFSGAGGLPRRAAAVSRPRPPRERGASTFRSSPA